MLPLSSNGNTALTFCGRVFAQRKAFRLCFPHPPARFVFGVSARKTFLKAAPFIPRSPIPIFATIINFYMVAKIARRASAPMFLRRRRRAFPGRKSALTMSQVNMGASLPRRGFRGIIGATLLFGFARLLYSPLFIVQTFQLLLVLRHQDNARAF